MREFKRWLEHGLNLLTVLALGTAIYFLLNERVIPALRGEPSRTIEGEKLPAVLQFEPLSGAGKTPHRSPIRVPGDRAALLLVFDSTCPACYANLPAWRELLDAAGGSVASLAVGLDRDRTAGRSYARRHLPTARAVAVADARELTDVLGVRLVPFTALVDAEGVLRFAAQGSLDSTAVRTAIRALEALTGSSNR